jgi:uncharacterized protein (TIGR02271 family)
MDQDRKGTSPGNERVASEMILPLIAEELEISKRLKEAGRLRISKRVNSTASIVDEQLRNEHYEVKRVPVNQTIDKPVEPRQEGDTLIFPILEEVLVVEKRLVLVEEVHVTRRIEEKRERHEVDLRKEEIEIERVEPRDGEV